MTPDCSDPALAFALLQQTRRSGQLIAILRGAGRLDRVARLAAAFPDGVEVLLLPTGPFLRPKASATLATPTDAPRAGETVVHVDHGVYRLTRLRQVGDEDRLVLEFADRLELLIPPTVFDRVLRYSDTGSKLDRAGGTAWRKRRVKIEAELQLPQHSHRNRHARLGIDRVSRSRFGHHRRGAALRRRG